MGRVGFDGFVILWPKPNLTRYKFFFFVTQPNPSSPKNQPNPMGQVGWVGFGRSMDFLHIPTLYILICSDRILLLKAFEGWNDANHDGKKRQWDKFLSSITLQMTKDMRMQFVALFSIGFVSIWEQLIYFKLKTFCNKKV